MNDAKSICNKDCFNCPYPDCINDELDYEDYRELAQIDKDLTSTPIKKKLAAQQKAYREANREKVAAAQKAYREGNREKLAAAQKAYYEANREKLAAQQKAIKDTRLRLGLSQKYAAALFGISGTAFSYWERGLVPCDADAALMTLQEQAKAQALVQQMAGRETAHIPEHPPRELPRE